MSSKTIFLCICGPAYGAAQFPENKDLETVTHESPHDAVMYITKKLIAFWHDKVQVSKTFDDIQVLMTALSAALDTPKYENLSFNLALPGVKYHAQVTAVNIS